jgi:hypothetical protein
VGPTVLEGAFVDERINVFLRNRSEPLMSPDLLLLSQIAEKASAIAHISQKSSQLLIGIPKVFYPELAEALRAMGYERVGRSGTVYKRSRK